MRTNDPIDIYHWRRVNTRLTTSGQPTEAQLAHLADLGVTHIINLGLHTHEKALPDEAATVSGLGLHYIHIPVAFDAPSYADFEAFASAFEAVGDAQLHVHCIANLRVSAFFYRFWRDRSGMPEADARALMDSIWQPGGIWADFIGDSDRIDEPHGPARTTSEEN